MNSAGDDCIQFTRHAGDVLFNLNRLRSRHILTDVTILAGGREFHAHKTVLMACSGFFYTMFVNTQKSDQTVVSLDAKVDPTGFAILLDFMYTSRLTLNEHFILATLNTAIYLQMDHMVGACERFMESRGLCVKQQPRAEVAASPAPLPQDVTFNLREVSRNTLADVMSLGPPVVHYAVSTSTSSPMRYCGHLPFSAGSPSDVTSLLWQVPNTAAVTQGQRPPPDGKGSIQTKGSGLFPVHQPCRPSVVLQIPPAMSQPDQGRPRGPVGTKVEEEAENFGHSHAIGPHSPLRSDCQPNSPAESSSCSRATVDPQRPVGGSKVHNWKKYKFIVLNSSEGEESHGSDSPSHTALEPTTNSSESPSMILSNPTSSSVEECAENAGVDRSSCIHKNTHGCNMDISETSRESSSLVCSECNTRVNTNSENNTNHQRLQQGKPYKCDRCQTPVAYKGILNGHKSTSPGEKPYRCSVCGAQFNRPANLKTHLRIHSGEKPYKCETCGSCFVQVAHLRAHVLIHTGEKPYVCNICTTRFRHLQTLKSHLRIHTGEKPYRCDMCELHFRHKSQLRLHLRQKHGAVTNIKAVRSRPPH